MLSQRFKVLTNLILEVVENYDVDVSRDDTASCYHIRYDDYTVSRYKAEHNGNTHPIALQTTSGYNES